MRFSLAGIGAIALAAAVFAQPASKLPTDDEKKAIDLIVNAGGKAEIDPSLAPEARVSAKFESATEGVLVGLKKSPHIGAIDVFDATACTEKGFTSLKSLPNLRKLTLGKSEMTLPRLTAIAQCKELRVLYIAGSGLTDTGLVTMKKLTRLEQLDISDNPLVTDKGMATLKTLDRLQVLFLNKTGISNKGLAELKVLDGLHALSVVGTAVTAEAAEEFADAMPNLRAVRR